LLLIRRWKQVGEWGVKTSYNIFITDKEFYMRSIWSGSLVFGLVNIPIKLYSASEDKSLNLTMLHKKDNSPIRYAKICKAEEKEITYQEVVKGYEYEKGEYVVLTDKDFEKANVESSHAIEVIEFTDESELDLRFFDKPYYLEPDKSADKAYALLRDALIKAKKIAITKFMLHNREHLGVLKPINNLLVLNRIRFATEVRSPAELKLPKINLNNNEELEMALALIKQLTKHFKPEQFHDTYIEDLEKAINIKLKGKKAVLKTKIPQKTTAVNLMKALKASLEKTKSTGKHKKVA
jgi:DNA end-binding protein Ku